MSQRPCRTLRELAGHGGCLVAYCKCGRVAALSISHLVALYREHRWDDEYREIKRRLRCDRRTGGCGQRPVRLAYHQGKSPVIGGISRILIAPRGIDPVEWTVADERERKRMINRVRG